MEKMSRTSLLVACVLTGVAFTVFTSAMAADGLERRFKNPPDAAKPLTWWHWLDGNTTKEGITGDWESIKRAGLGGAYLFNCGVGMPKGPIKFMQTNWLDMMDHTMHEAERLGLKFGIHNCDGFSQSGGPWITSETSMKELTWTVREVEGPAAFDGVLEKPESKKGFYRDIAVIAFPVPQGVPLSGPGSAVRRQGTLSEAELAKLTDGKDDTKAEILPPAGSGGPGPFDRICVGVLTCPQPFMPRSRAASFFC